MKRVRTIVSLSSILAGMIIFATSPSASSVCAGPQRAGTRGLNISVATGVSAVIEVTNDGILTDTVSGADVWLGNSSGSAYVQIGWYVGQASQLPYSSTPRLFWGENSPDPTFHETLHAGPQLTAGTYYRFQVTNPLDGSNKFNVWLQDTLIGTSTYAHTIGYPGFVGEVGDGCTTMDGWAAHKQSPYSSLQYRYNGSWVYFSGTLYDSANGQYYGGRPYDNFTAFALG